MFCFVLFLGWKHHIVKTKLCPNFIIEELSTFVYFIFILWMDLGNWYISVQQETSRKRNTLCLHILGLYFQRVMFSYSNASENLIEDFVLDPTFQGQSVHLLLFPSFPSFSRYIWFWVSRVQESHERSNVFAYSFSACGYKTKHFTSYLRTHLTV